MIATSKMSFTLRIKKILFCPGRTGSLLWATKEAKLPARNFFIQVSRKAWSVPSQKIDHAGLRAERRNGGLALWGGHSDRISRFFFQKNDSLAIATLLSGLEMMEGENVKASTTIFQPTTTQGSASSPDSSSGACAAEKKL